MRLPQITFSLEESYTAMLKTIASAYGLSVSAYVGSILVRIIKDEVVDLNIPLDKILDKEDYEDFKQSVEASYYISKAFAPKHLQESEAEYYRFREYVLSGRVKDQVGTNVTPYDMNSPYTKTSPQKDVTTVGNSYPTERVQDHTPGQTTAHVSPPPTYAEPLRQVREFEEQNQAGHTPTVAPVVEQPPTGGQPKKKHRIGGL